MKYLVVTIECILFFIFINFLGAAMLLSFVNTNNLPLLIGVAIFFISLFIASCYIAYRSVKATLNMFKGINDNPIVFCSKIIKKDKGFRKLLVLALVELAVTLFWIVFVSLLFFAVMIFDYEDWLAESTNDLLCFLFRTFPPYLAFLLGAYLTLRQILKTFLQNNTKLFWNSTLTLSIFIQTLILILTFLFHLIILF